MEILCNIMKVKLKSMFQCEEMTNKSQMLLQVEFRFK